MLICMSFLISSLFLRYSSFGAMTKRNKNQTVHPRLVGSVFMATDLMWRSQVTVPPSSDVKRAGWWFYNLQSERSVEAHIILNESMFDRCVAFAFVNWEQFKPMLTMFYPLRCYVIPLSNGTWRNPQLMLADLVPQTNITATAQVRGRPVNAPPVNPTYLLVCLPQAPNTSSFCTSPTTST
jgi:hypothetical protein